MKFLALIGIVALIWLVGLFAFAVVALYIASNIVLTQAYARPSNQRSVALDSRIGGALSDSISSNATVKTFGADHIIMGTDYPFDMLEFDPIGHINSVASFDSSTRAALAGGNAKKMLGI